MPNEDFIELRIGFDPQRFTADDIVQATKMAMEKYQDPKFLAGVEVVYIEGEPEILPIIVSSERVVGENRFVLALLDLENEPILDAKVYLRCFQMVDGKPALKTEADAEPVTITKSFVETHADGTVHKHAVVDPLFEKYGDRVNFIHVEPYDLEKARQGIGLFLTDTMKEWGLKTEPWLFVIDREGKIAAKFEGIAALEEVEAALRQVVAHR